ARAAWALQPALAERLSAPIHAMLLAVRVRGLIDLGRPAEALNVANAAMDVAIASGSSDAIMHAIDARVVALTHVGDMSEAITAGTSLIQTAEGAGDVVVATRVRLSTGSVLNHMGVFEQAQEMLDRALGDARGRRLRVFEGYALHNLGMSFARLGNI